MLKHITEHEAVVLYDAELNADGRVDLDGNRYEVSELLKLIDIDDYNVKFIQWVEQQDLDGKFTVEGMAKTPDWNDYPQQNFIYSLGHWGCKDMADWAEYWNEDFMWELHTVRAIMAKLEEHSRTTCGGCGDSGEEAGLDTDENDVVFCKNCIVDENTNADGTLKVTYIEPKSVVTETNNCISWTIHGDACKCEVK